MTAAEALLKRIILQHHSVLPQSLVLEASELLGLVEKRDPWSRFLRLPDSGSRAALGALSRQYGGPAVTRAIESLLRNAPKAGAFAKLKTMLKGGDSADRIDSVGNCLPPAF